ncbi:MAG: tripartite ATP-independent transporter DctM subunit [Gammaproteobacteria bacterium]|jgi:tripartite ATP-independent transporter DctM subunit
METYFLVLLVVTMAFALISGFPVAFALPGSAILTITLAALSGYVFEGDTDAYFVLGGPNQWLSAGVTNFRSLYWNVERDTLIAIPLFVFMGIMLQRSKIAEDLLVAMAQLFGPVPGGLGISVVFVGALLAATTGIVGATVIAMGMISLPAMLRNNYSKSLACGTICASGTLGQIIPPSIVLIILADQLSNAADQAATMRKADFKEATGSFSMPGDFDVVSASAGDMFMGAFIPGLILVGLYMLYILITAIISPEKAPPVPFEGKYDRRFAVKILLALTPPLTLIFVVLGSIILGVATVNQAGAVGAVGALIMGSYRLMEGKPRAYVPAIIAVISLFFLAVLIQTFDLNIKNIQNSSDAFGITLAGITVLALLTSIGWSVWRAYRIDDTLVGVMTETAKTTSMVFIILIGAAMLTSAFRAFGGEELVKGYLTSLPGGFWIQFIVVMAVIFFLGFFLDFIEIAVVVVPIVAPILLADPGANITAVWLGVMIGLNIQTSFLTPPFGFALFYLRGVAPPQVKTTQIYKGAVAFIGLQLLGLTIAGFYPPLVNYLPNKTYLTSETAPPPSNPKLQQCLENTVFEDYEANKQTIIASIDQIKSINLSYLPDEYQNDLTESFSKAAKSFSLIDELKQSRSELELFKISYRPIHHEARAIERKLKTINEQIKLASALISDLTKSGNGNSLLEREIQRKESLQQNFDQLQNNLPELWSDSKQRFDQLFDLANRASRNYRRNADESYEVIQVMQKMLSEHQSLQVNLANLESLTTVIEHQPAAQAIQQIKLYTTQLADFTNVSSIQSKLSKARRILKKNANDIEKSIYKVTLAIKEMKSEIEWRQQAGEKLIPELTIYNDAIRMTIGMRLQKRLTPDQANSVASCLAAHRDISLHF